MPKNYSLIWIKSFLILTFIVFLNIHSDQNYWVRETFEFKDSELREKNTQLKLRTSNIIRNSEQFFLNGEKLVRDINYVIDYKSGIVELIYFSTDSENIFLEIVYLKTPDILQRSFYYYQIQEDFDLDTTEIPPPSRVFFDLPADSRINIGGAKTFTLQTSRTESFTFDQTLFLKLTGELSDNVFIDAQLSDSFSPVTPRGQSKELSEIEQLYIRVYSQKYELSFGKLEAAINNSHFINYRTQFDGIKASWHGNNSFKGALAVTDSKQGSNKFWGKNGKQGPYYLSMDERPGFTQIVSGSESVYLNGRLMYRNQDYSINYHDGYIVFKSKNIITSNSNIFVTFSYSDQDYKQFLYLNSNRLYLTDNLYIQNSMVILKDDKDNPLNFSFSDEDKAILRQTGDNRAFKSGIVKTEFGKGNYIKVVSEDEYFFEYAGEGQGNYLISFSYIGPDSGDYERRGFGIFSYVGEGKGDWLPLIELPLPEHKANYNLLIGNSDNNVTLQAEALITEYDKNTFSSLDSTDNYGKAGYLEFQYHPDFDMLTINNKFYLQYLSENLTPLSTIRDPAFSYQIHEFTAYEKDLDKEHDNIEVFNKLILHKPKIFTPELSVSYKRWNDATWQVYSGIMVRFFQQKYLPEVNLRISRSEHHQKKIEAEVNQEELGIAYVLGNLRLSSNLNSRTSSATEVDEFKSRKYTSQKFSLSTHNLIKIASEVYYLMEQNKEKPYYPFINNTANTIGTISMINFRQQNAQFNISQTVQEYDDGNTNKYTMLDFSSTNSFLRNSISANLNLSRNNLEYFPMQRKLIYVGIEEGVFDSTGVYSDEGEYDYIYFKDGESALSTETKRGIILFLNPYLYLSTIDKSNFSENLTSIITELEKIQFDLNLIQQRDRTKHNYEESLPAFSYYHDFYRQNIWYNIVRRKLSLRHSYQVEKLKDSRYSFDEEKRNFRSNEIMLRFLNILTADLDYSVKLEEEKVNFRYRDYDSETLFNSVRIFFRINSDLLINTNFAYSSEDASSGNLVTRIRSFYNDYNITSFFRKDFRFIARFNYRYNKISRDNIFWFEPEKNSRNVYRLFLSMNRRISHVSNLNFEYNMDKYDNRKTNHSFKAELVMEF